MRENDMRKVTNSAGQLILTRPAESTGALMEIFFPVCSVILPSGVFHQIDRSVKEIQTSVSVSSSFSMTSSRELD